MCGSEFRREGYPELRALKRDGAFGNHTGSSYGKIFFFRSVLFEALDEKVFAYTRDQVYEIKMRLYEVEQKYADNHFARCSKSVVLNLMLLENISPALNGRFFAHMKNGERLMISRQYAQKMKQIVMGGGRDED